MPPSTSFRRAPAWALVACVLCCAQPQPAAAQSIVPTQSEREAYETGRASARTVLVFQYPQVCAIVLERPRCSRDLDRFLARFPRFPAADAARLRAAFANGYFAKLDMRYGEIDTTFVAEPERLKDAHAAWLIEAGIASVEVPAALDQVHQVMALPNALALARDAGAAGSFRSLVPDAIVDAEAHVTPDPKGTVPLGLPVDQALTYQAAIVKTLAATFPPQAFPHIAYAQGRRGDAQLGVAVATLMELSEVPRMLAQPDAQHFVDETFVRLIETSPVDATRLQALRADFAVGPEIDRLYRSGGAIEKLIAVQRHLDQGTLRALLVGQLSAQLAFNADVYRDVKFSNTFRSQVERFDDADASVPGLDRLRAALRVPAAKDWPRINAAAGAIVERLVQS